MFDFKIEWYVNCLQEDEERYKTVSKKLFKISRQKLAVLGMKRSLFLTQKGFTWTLTWYFEVLLLTAKILQGKVILRCSVFSLLSLPINTSPSFLVTAGATVKSYSLIRKVPIGYSNCELQKIISSALCSSSCVASSRYFKGNWSHNRVGFDGMFE